MKIDEIDDDDISSNSIPKLIHQMWLSESEPEIIGPPAKYLEYCKSIKTINKHFEYRFWNFKQIQELFENPKLVRWKEFFYKLESLIEKCDFSRYAIMYIYGGIYIDCDFLALNPLDDLLIKHKEIILTLDIFNIYGIFPRENTWPKDWNMSVFNGFLASKPNNIFWSEFMNFILFRYNPLDDVLYNTGPGSLGIFTQKMKFDKQLHPEWYIEKDAILPKYQFYENGVKKYLYTKWSEGSMWYLNFKQLIRFTRSYIRNNELLLNIAAIVLIVVGLSLLAVIIYLFYRNKYYFVDRYHELIEG